MRALRWYKRNRRMLSALLREAKARSGLPEQPEIMIATLQYNDFRAVEGSYSSLHTQGGIPSQEECEWLAGNHAGDCGDDPDDFCTGPCAKFDTKFPEGTRTIPTNTCLYYWAAVRWSRQTTTYYEPYLHLWFTQPTEAEGFWTGQKWGDEAEGIRYNSSEPNINAGQYGGAGVDDPASPETQDPNHRDDYSVVELNHNVFVGDPVEAYPNTGLPPAINLAVVGAVKNSEHDDPSGSPGWNHWWSFRHSSNCRFKEAPFSGSLVPAMNVNKFVDEDGEEVSTSWFDFNPIVLQPIGNVPIVPLHFFPANHRADTYIYDGVSDPPVPFSGDFTQMNINYPFFCCTPLYTGGGCCCVVE